MTPRDSLAATGSLGRPKAESLAVALPLVDGAPLRLTLSVQEACAALGVGHDFFSEHVAPELRIVRVGRRKLVPVGELVAWLDRHAEVALQPRVSGFPTPVPGRKPSGDAGSRGVRASRAPVTEEEAA